MNEIIIILFTAFLFFIFTPGIFFTISKKSSKTNNAVIHAFLFAFFVYLIHIIFYNNIYEGLTYNNGNYPMACNSLNLGERNENNYVCIQDTNTKKYMWGLECKNSKDLNNKNDKNQVCEFDENNNYNWNTKK
uniref:Uncharacterized protein n=1 Tax=viral metagenome TaxID=1070528 RepID=A0A6C0HT79_9ZZZZ